MKIFSRIFILIILFSFISVGCSEVQIPEYPGAVEDQEHKAEFAGMTFGKVRRVLTDDPYDTVLTYYMNALEAQTPEITSFTLEDGRQTAINIKKDVTIVIQEFKKEGKTAIVYMN